MEMGSGWDDGVKEFFGKILNSVALGLLWMMTAAILGIYFELGFLDRKPVYVPVIFYTALIVTFSILLRHLVKTWKKKTDQLL